MILALCVSVVSVWNTLKRNLLKYEQSCELNQLFTYSQAKPILLNDNCQLHTKHFPVSKALAVNQMYTHSTLILLCFSLVLKLARRQSPLNLLHDAPARYNASQLKRSLIVTRRRVIVTLGTSETNVAKPKAFVAFECRQLQRGLILKQEWISITCVNHYKRLLTCRKSSSSIFV